MRRREQYKHLLNLAANVVMLAIEGILFGYTWYVIYYPLLEKENQPFNRGNWAVIGMYLLVVYFFTRTFGGYKVGYLRITDICLSQELSIFSANVVGYLQVCLVANDYMPVHPMAALTGAELAAILPCVYLVRRIYTRLYPPRKMLVIYGTHSPQDLIRKINSRKVKYNVCATASVYMGYEALYRKILEYEAVVLCDLPTKMRNPILKFCFDQNKRTYITPKISDIILTGTERFPVLLGIYKELRLAHEPLLPAEPRHQLIQIDDLLDRKGRGGLLSVAEGRIGDPDMFGHIDGHDAVIERYFRNGFVVEQFAVQMRFLYVLQFVFVNAVLQQIGFFVKKYHACSLPPPRLRGAARFVFPAILTKLRIFVKRVMPICEYFQYNFTKSCIYEYL